jgi:carotenoid cleavage dioxygenase
MYFFGYEASGLATRDVAFCVANRGGELIREEWFQAPCPCSRSSAQRPG